MKQIKKYISQKLVISIAAGISTGYIENKLGKIRVIRVMPNLPAKVGKGMICLCKGQYSLRADLDLTLELFVYLGKTMLIKENLMNTATAISGSGPGYFYHLIQDKPKKDWEVYAQEQFIPALSASAQRIGFNSDQAQLLAQTTAVGSIALLEESGIPPGILCAQVASKGGTTEAGLKVLQRNIDYLEDSVTAALKRAGELSKKTD